MLKQTISLLAALLIGLTVFVWIESFSSSFQICVNQETAKAAADQGNDKNYSFPILVRSYARCTERFANERNALITAVATVLLSIITLGLVWSAVEQQNTTRAQLRAYLSVVIGAAVYQDDTHKFEAKPAILNNGQTPAYNVRYGIKAEILSDSVAAGFTFTEPPDVPKSQSSIGPRENRLMSAIVVNRVPNNQIPNIKWGVGQALWVWGVVHYDDIFGKPHFTQFCQRLSWLPDGNILGLYDGRFGNSN
jgi:hypothetical protein